MIDCVTVGEKLIIIAWGIVSYFLGWISYATKLKYYAKQNQEVKKDE